MKPGRVRGGVDLLQLLYRHPGVDLRGLQLGVAQNVLDVADVGSVLEPERGHGMPEDMAGPVHLDAGFDDFLFDQVAQVVVRSGLRAV